MTYWTVPTDPKVLLVEPSRRSVTNRLILSGLADRGLVVPYFESFAEMAAAGVGLSNAEVLITYSCSREIMEQAPKLRAIINPYIGSESIDRDAATERGVIVGYGPTRQTYVGMAEATILLLLSCLYDLAEGERLIRANATPTTISARTLMGKVVGLISFGRIAQAVAERLQGWDVDLLVSAPRLPAPLPPWAQHVELDALLAQSDAVLVLCSLNDSTRNLLSREKLALMKPRAVLINTSRGGIIDEQALAEMLTDGRLRRAAIDAFEVEPLPANSPLRQAPNAILTPHMIGVTTDGLSAMSAVAVEGVARSLAGEPPIHILNPEVVDMWRARLGT